MRLLKRLFGILSIAMAISSGKAFADCSDTTVTVSGVYDPSSLNGVINSCASTSMVVTLSVNSDTLRLSNSIFANRPGKTFTLTSKNPLKSDSLVTLVESAANPALLTSNSTTSVTLSNIGFARKTLNSGTPTVSISGPNSWIHDCHFWTSDTVSSNEGATLIQVTSDLVLIERCLFRAPVIGATGGAGHSLAIQTTASSSRTEIRSCLFVSTGVRLNRESAHLMANTFVGSRNTISPVVFTGNVNTNTNLQIWNNIFAAKVDNRAPIYFVSTTVPADGASIIRNAFASSKSLVERNGVAVTVTAATVANQNVQLPDGLSNYADADTAKDYPLIQMRMDPTLARVHADFGKIPINFQNYPTPITGISSIVAANSFFSLTTFPFRTFFPGQAWLSSAKVGCFIDYDSRVLPSPLDSIAFIRASDSTKLKVSRLDFDVAYYGSTNSPTLVKFAFATTPAGVASNDTSSLANTVNLAYPLIDSIINVPKAVRTGGPIYVKVFEYNATGRAHIIASSAYTSTSILPAFPVNDLAVSISKDTAALALGVLGVSVTKGGEGVDSVRIIIATETGSIPLDSLTKPFTGATATFSFNLAAAGKKKVTITSMPIAILSGVAKLGARKVSGTAEVNRNTNDVVYVSTGATCAGGTGTVTLPFCNLDSAFADLKTKSGGTIVIHPNSGPLPPAFLDTTDAFPVTIQPLLDVGNKFPAVRPIIRGSGAAPALTIRRKNLTLLGLVFEMPQAADSNQPAVSLLSTADNIRIEGCLFRAANNPTTGVEGAAIHLQTFSGALDALNNVIWGFKTGLNVIQTSANKVRFINNTLIEDKAQFGVAHAVTGINASNITTFAPIISSNLFYQVSTPFAATIAGKMPQISNNVYTTANPNLVGLAEAGGTLDSLKPLLGGMNLSGTKYSDTLSNKFLLGGGLLDFGAFTEPNSLIAGSAALSDTLVNKDFFGKDRTGKHEVGAIQLDRSTVSIPLGRLKISVLSDSDPTKLTMNISSRNFDPTLADSLVFYYSTLKNPGTTDFLGRGSVGINSLSGSIISKEFAGLIGKQSYYFFARFAKKGPPISLGFPFTDSAKTGTIQVFPGNTVDISQKPGTIFPDPDGVFTDTAGVYRGWKGTIVFRDSVSTGTVCAPKLSLSTILGGGIDPFPNAPLIEACFENENLGKPGSNLHWTLKIDDLPLLPNEINKEVLYGFPTTGLPIYVPDWSVTNTGTSSSITIKGFWPGSYKYQIGHLSVAANSGQVTPTVIERMDYSSFAKFKDSTKSIPITIQGSGFHTSNPLIFAIPVPAGGKPRVSLNLADRGNPFGTNYFSSVQVKTASLGLLGSELLNSQFTPYFKQMAITDSGRAISNSAQNPLTLNPALASGNFANSVDLSTSDIVIDPAGAMGPTVMNIPMKYSSRDKADGGGGASRSIEVYFLIFDGGKISTVSSYIGTQFNSEDLSAAELPNSPSNQWHLFSYPWSENLNGQFYRLVGDTNKWDPNFMVVYRYKGLGTGRDAFEQYQGGDATGWAYDSTHALWVASSRTFSPNSLFGKSLDTSPFSMLVPASKWTLFGVPFNFPMRWKDVTTNSAQPKGNTFRFIAEKPGRWEALNEQSIVEPWQGLAIFPSSSMVLNFPVMDTTRSAAALPKMVASGANSWNANFLAQNSSAAMDLKIGKAQSQKWLSEPPMVPKQNYWISLASEQGLASEVIQNNFSGPEGIWPLSIQSLGESSEPISISLKGQNGELPLYLVEATSQTVQSLKAGESVTVPTVDAAMKQYSIAAGESMVAKALRMGSSPFMLHLANVPNPFSSSTRIRYELPAQHQDVTYQLNLIDMSGRSIFKKSIHAGAKLDFVWNGQTYSGAVIPAGRYHLSLLAKTAAGVQFKAQRDVLKLR